jgi:hypothetical protein
MSKGAGFNRGGEKIEGFSATCEKCGSGNVEVAYEFTYYSSYTGWDISLEVCCMDCDNRTNLLA